MKSTPEYDHIDHQFIKAIDEIILINKELGLKPSNDSALGNEIYPTNRSIISAVRNRQKHIPHMALINLAKRFSIDMNFFYTAEEKPLQYQPKTLNDVYITKNGINSAGANAVNIHAGKGKIKRINTAEAGSTNTLVETVEVNTMINNFISQIDKDHVQKFLGIVSSIQHEHKATANKMEVLLEQKSIEIKEVRDTFKEEMKAVREELKETRTKLDDALKREVDLLRELLNSK